MEEKQRVAVKATADAAAFKVRVRVAIKLADQDMMDGMHKQIETIIESKPSGGEWEHFLDGTGKTCLPFRAPVRALHRCIAQHTMVAPLCLDTFLQRYYPPIQVYSMLIF